MGKATVPAQRPTWLTLLLLVILGIVVAVAQADAGAQVAAVTTFGPNNSPCASDRLLVKFRPGASAGAIASAHAAAGAVSLQQISQLGLHVVVFQSSDLVDQRIACYLNDPAVEFVEPDYLYAPTPGFPTSLTVSSPRLESQWLCSPAAWSAGPARPDSLVVGLDTGILSADPDLNGRVLGAWAFADNAPGELTARGMATVGVAGSAALPGQDNGTAYWRDPVLCVAIGEHAYWASAGDIANAIVLAADQGARAITLDFAGADPSRAIAAAIEYAWAKGAVLVAGSAAPAAAYPARFPHVFAVSALTDQDTLFPGDRGASTQVCVPVSFPAEDSFDTSDAAQVAAPVVTGLFGMLFSAQPDLTPQQAVDIVCRSAYDLGDPGFDAQYGWGRINLRASLQSALEFQAQDAVAPSVTISSPAPNAALSNTVAVTASASDDVGVVRVEFYLDGALQATVASAPYTWDWDTTQAASGAHSLAARAYDAAGNVGISPAVPVTVSNYVTETFTGNVNPSHATASHPITLTAAGAIAAALAWSGRNADLDLYLYSPTGALLASSTTRGTGGAEQIAYTASIAGTYTLVVQQVSKASNYTLTVTHP